MKSIIRRIQLHLRLMRLSDTEGVEYMLGRIEDERDQDVALEQYRADRKAEREAEEVRLYGSVQPSLNERLVKLGLFYPFTGWWHSHGSDMPLTQEECDLLNNDGFFPTGLVPTDGGPGMATFWTESTP